MSDEELKRKREEKLKLREEGDRLFFVRLGRFALVAVCLASIVFLPGIALWRTLEQDYPNRHFWSNLGWLLLGDLYAIGALAIVCVLIYLAGGSRGLKLCGADECIDDNGAPLFLMFPAIGCLIYGFLFLFGIVLREAYLWVK